MMYRVPPTKSTGVEVKLASVGMLARRIELVLVSMSITPYPSV
jgi:hypothetical protein